MDNTKTYDLKREVEQAELDHTDASRLVTPSGFVLSATEGDRELVQLDAPCGGNLLMSRYLMEVDADDPKMGGSWHYDLPHSFDSLEVEAMDEDYDLPTFIRSLIAKWIDLGNARRKEWQPYNIFWNK